MSPSSSDNTGMNAPAKETLGFQTEVKQLLHLMIHSLYGNKEIFLRELVSNASDACDRLRFDGIADRALLEDDPELKIRVSYDKAARTITVSDNGIGMSRQEVIDQIGTIAKSGTREFFKTPDADSAKDAQLIGQFGVGFYSVLHRRRPRDAGDAPRRDGRPTRASAGRAPAKATTASSRCTRRRAAPTSSCTCGRTKDDLLSGSRAARDPAQVLRPHHHPDPDEEGAVGRERQGAGRHRRGRAGQPGVGALGAAQVGDHRGAVPRVLQARRARLRAAARLQPREGRRPPGVHAAALHPAAGAVRSVGPRASSRHQAVRPARVHHGRRRAADAGVPALRPRRHRLERPAAQRVARDPAAVDGRRADSRRVGQARARRARRSRRESAPRSTRRSGRSSAAPSRKGSSRMRRTRSGSRSCCGLRPPSAMPTSRRRRWPTTSAG